MLDVIRSLAYGKNHKTLYGCSKPRGSSQQGEGIMQDILEQYQHIKDSDDIFAFWEQELNLRSELRQKALTAKTVVDSAAHMEFLYRSLYFSGRKYDFFKILFSSLRFMSVLQWLVDAPAKVIKEFLRFLPWYIINNRVKPAELEFIARVFQDEYGPAFKEIINVLDDDHCAYLASRSANPDLRRLLKDRQSTLQQRRMESYYTLEGSTRNYSIPTIYGDKVQLIRASLEKLQDCSADRFSDPYQAERFLLQIEAAGMAFKCGLVEDSLAFLLDIYNDYQQKNRLVDMISDHKIYKNLQQLLRIVIPSYCLVFEPLSAYSCSGQLYQKYFPLISPEIAPLRYLRLWEVITAAFANPADNFPELLYTAKTVSEYRPMEPPLLLEKDMDGMSLERLEQLLDNGEEKLEALPHETFIIMELVRLLHHKDRVLLNGPTASRLLHVYMLLWQWLPCNLFMHTELLEQIAPLVDNHDRYEAQRIVDSIQNMSSARIKSDLALRPQLFRKKSENIRRSILAGKLMGAL
jgi:hypothetical protein